MLMNSFSFTIEGQPATKKNHGIIARGHAAILPSKNYKKYADSFRQQLQTKQRPHFKTGVQVTALYYLRDRAHYPDLVGLMQATADIISDEYAVINHKKVLAKRWILADDRIIKSWDGTKIAGIDKERPRVEITITKLETDLSTETDPQIIRVLEASRCTNTTTT